MTKTQQKQKLQTPTKPNHTDKTIDLTFMEHIYELRSRLFWIVATIVLGSAAGFQFKDQLIQAVMAPLHGQKLVYLTPGGGFGFIFTVAIYFGVLIAIPIIIYHVYRFLQPLLQRTSRKLVATFMLLSCLLAAGGAAFGYFVTVPAALDFLETFAGDAVTPNLTADSYLNFVVSYILGLALLFQLPLLLFLFDHVRPFPPGSLLSTQRFVIIGATIAAAIITPTPDAINLALVAVPIIAIYQLGVIAIFVRHSAIKRASRKTAKRQHAAQSEPTPTEEPLTQIFRGIDAHSPTMPAPERIVTRKRGAMSDITAKKVQEVTPSTATRSTLRTPSTRTIDGVIRARSTQSVLAPARTQTPERLVTARDQYTKPVRSLDGLSMLGYSTNS